MQDLIADMLGVRRQSVTAAAGRLQEAGLMQCSRGKITVLDRPKLEARVCECYAVVKREYDRLLPASGLTASRLGGDSQCSGLRLRNDCRAGSSPQQHSCACSS